MGLWWVSRPNSWLLFYVDYLYGWCPCSCACLLEELLFVYVCVYFLNHLHVCKWSVQRAAWIWRCVVNMHRKSCVGKYDSVMSMSEVYVNVSIMLIQWYLTKYGWRNGVLMECRENMWYYNRPHDGVLMTFVGIINLKVNMVKMQFVEIVNSKVNMAKM